MADAPETDVPDGLKWSGRRLWAAVAADFELSEHETSLLMQACRTVDLLDQLQARIEADGPIIDSPDSAEAAAALSAGRVSGERGCALKRRQQPEQLDPIAAAAATPDEPFDAGPLPRPRSCAVRLVGVSGRAARRAPAAAQQHRTLTLADTLPCGGSGQPGWRPAGTPRPGG